MQPCRPSAYRIVLDIVIFAKSIRDYVGIFLVLTHLDLFLIKLDVKSGIRLIKAVYVKIVYDY